ncbi:MAG: twin-arginine translocation pathway signal protein, partial [Pseudomonadota bacterium]
MKRILAAAAGLTMMMAASVSWAGGAGTGSFKGLSNHVTKGEVEVVKVSDGWEIHLKDSFWFDGAPDPRVGFGKN